MFNQEQLAAVAAAMSILQSMQPNAQTTTSPTATNCPATDLLLGDAVNNNNNDNTNASALAAAQQQLAATWASTRQHHQQQQQQLQIQQLQQQFQHTHLDQAGPPKQSYLQQLQQQLQQHQQHQHQQQLHQLQHQRPQLTSLPPQLPPHLTQQLPHLTQLPHLQQHQQQQPQQLQQTHVQQHQQTPQQQSQLHLNPSLNNHRTNTTATSAKAVEVNKPIPYSAIVAKSAGLAPTTTRTNATAIVSNHNAGLVSTNNSNHNNTGASNNHHQQLGVSTNHNHQLGSNSNSISINNHNQNNISNNNNSSSISNILNNTSASKATNNFTTNNTSTLIAPTATITSQSIVNNHHPESGKATNLLGYMGLYVGNLSPDLSKEQLEKIFSMYGEPVKAHRLIRSPVAFIKYENTESPRAAIDDLYGILLPGMTLNQDQPLKLHFDRNDAQLKANYRPTELPKEDNGECYGWRTTVCRKGKNCPKKHIPINRGIDFQMWMIKSNLTTGTVPTTATSS